jgi:hypothetical protein
MSEYRDIDGFPGYGVSADGKVMGRCGFVLAVSKAGTVSLYRDGKPHVRKVAELVAEVWGAAQQEKPVPTVPQHACADCPHPDEVRRLGGVVRDLEARLDLCGVEL